MIEGRFDRTGQNRALLADRSDITALQSLSVGTHEIVLNTTNGYGSDVNNKIRQWTNIERNVGTAMTLAQSATAGDSVTINITGIYGVSFAEQFNALSWFGISRNASLLTTAFTGLAIAERLLSGVTYVANSVTQISVSRILTAGDIIRCHTDGGVSGINTAYTKFSIVLLGKL